MVVLLLCIHMLKPAATTNICVPKTWGYQKSGNRSTNIRKYLPWCLCSCYNLCFWKFTWS